MKTKRVKKLYQHTSSIIFVFLRFFFEENPAIFFLSVCAQKYDQWDLICKAHQDKKSPSSKRKNGIYYQMENL